MGMNALATMSREELDRNARRHFPFLPSSQATVAYLALIQGLDNAQIAERLGISYGGAAILLHRATKKVGARTHRQGLAQLFLLSAVKTGMRDGVFAENLELVTA